MKQIEINFSGLEKFADAQDAQGNGLDAQSGFDIHSESPYELTFSIGEDEYSLDDFSDEEDILPKEERKKFKNFDLNEFFKSTPDCALGVLYTNKGNGSIYIEIPDDEEFDPKKAAVVARKFLYDKDDYVKVMCAFAYDGRVYECDTEWTTGKYSETIWHGPKPDAVKLEKTTKEIANISRDEILSLPFLVFRTSQVGNCSEPEDNEPDLPEGDFFCEDGVIVVEASATNTQRYTKIGYLPELIENINSDINEEGISYCEVDVYVTEGYALINPPEREVSDKELIDTIQAVWDQTRDFADASPAFDKLLIRHIDHFRDGDYDEDDDWDDDNDDEENNLEEEQFDIQDYILIGKKLYRLRSDALAAAANRPTCPNLFDEVLTQEEYDRNASQNELYRSLASFKASNALIC